ncbi:pogo transposable element derived with ZNF domain b isoform X2 [Electrophorus electricus]|uniref:pogo transposable element derived with ZNF domain b isoform X2 n=1 Tax=Electrophorus electricus TaxID=8005 RepID=UPI0015D0C244|nr:pogo transposable element derived with ZNF domain b isoform X2 [Electrophorus electricus]
MEDADLFMECEEEELEPWQQMNQNEPDDSLATVESKTSTGGVPEVETPPVSTPVVISSMPASSNNVNTVPLLASTLPTAMPAGIPKGAPGQQLILTQGAGGLAPVALSQVILPGTSPASSAAGGQPIYFTTQMQGIPVQNIQSSQSPMGIVLNVQQGQTVRPFTLVQGVGATQIITQQAQMRPTTPVVNQAQAPSSFTAVQFPATLTLHSTVPTSQPRAQPTPSTAGPQPSTPPRVLPVNTATQIVTVKPEGNLDVQNMMSIVKSVTFPAGSPQQAFVVMSNQKTDSACSAAVQAAVPITQSNTVQAASAVLSHVCPRCGAQFKMIEALRGHMCFCCPDMTRTVSTSNIAPAAKPQTVQDKSFSMQIKSESMDVGPEETQSKIVMLVDDFYYGTFEGNRVYVPTDNLKEPISFKCFTCGKKLKNNIRLMNHMKFHMDVEQQTGEVDTHTSCPHCFRQFPTPFRLQCHVESVHSASESTSRCKICEWAFESEPIFLQHMKNTHKPGEMPYVCQVCQYRSSFYCDVHNHFRTWHEDTRYLLCVYCLKVFKNSSSYQLHFSRHQNSTVYNCNKCRLQFLFTKEKVEHKVNHHKTFRKPSQLEGLKAGTKVTIRAYAGQKKIASQMPSKASKDPSERNVNPALHVQASTQKLLVPQSSGTGKKQVRKMYDFLSKFQEHRALLGRHKCVECTFDIPDFANHYPTYVHCSLCPYSTCCSRAYANHMINNHVPGRAHKARSKRTSLSWLRLTCECCSYKTSQGDLMAKHLVQFPSHSYSIFTLKECLETDIEFCQVEEEVEGPQVEGASDVVAKPDWLSMEHWRVPSDGGSVPEFTDSYGPQHFMAKSSDVLDYFQLIFPDSLIDLIVCETNIFAKYQHSIGRGHPTWHPLTNEEAKGFIGLCILMGLQSLPEPEMYWSWEHYHNCCIFYRTMSATRFKQISSHIRMSSMLAEENDHSMNKLSSFQPLLKILEMNMQMAYKPNKYLTIDCALLPAQEKGTYGEKCRNSQPQIWLLCDSKSGYCHKLLILTQQEKNRDLGSLVVPNLMAGLEGKHHQIFISSLLVSVPLMKELEKKSIYCSSSIPAHSPVLPRDVWDQPALESPGSFVQFEYPPLLLTRWKDAKEMVCLSTNAVAGQPDTVWRRSTTKVGELSTISRPLAFKLLQDNMRGVDICKQLLACNQLGGLVLDTNWRQLFWFLVNLSIINSFIVLRETRKGNPPTWLQGGHFSQASYRRRLGYQLAKCAERQALQKQMNKDRFHQQRYEGSKEDTSTFEVVRHRLAKITFRTRRCKSCNLKNRRHESVYGCTACRVNLCKGSYCFWDFHGFSANFKGNPKTGFVEHNRQYLQPILNSSTFGSFPHGSSMDVSATSLEDTSRVEEDLDQEMAPVDLSDSDLEIDDSSQQKALKTEDGYKVSKPTPKPNSTKTTKEREETLSVRQLRILLFALCSGIHKAAKEMDTKPQLIRAWLRDKEKRLNDESLGTYSSGEAVDNLVEWVLVEREQQHPISEKNLFQKASEIHSQTTQSSSFRISYEWAVNFMLRHKLALHSVMSSCQLPRSMEESCLHFIEFVHRQIKMHSIPLSTIGAMDELSVFVDFDVLVESSTTSKETVFRLEGTGKPCINIYLAVLADGTMLPTMLFFKGTPLENISKELPDSVLLEARAEGFSEKEELELWTARVWRQHLRSQNRDKAMLVMDGHHGHMSEDFLSTMSGTKTLPIIIPSGCTSQCQPLEMCVRPVLQKFLLARWSQLAEKGRVAEVKAADLVWQLVAWLEEALAACRRTELIEYSFFFSHVITKQKEDKKEAITQLELMKMLTEAMLGTEAADPKPLAEEQSTESNDGVMETMKNALCKESHSKEDVEVAERQIVDEIHVESRTVTESNRTEQQAQEGMNKDLETSSETSKS